MDKKKKKAGILNSTFYRVYFSLVALALVAVVIGMVWLNGVVKDYETAQPVHVAEQVARLFEISDYASLYAMDTSAQDISGGDMNFYVEQMKALTAGKTIAWRAAFSSNADEKHYGVTLDGERFASFTLVPSGETTGHGNRLWKPGSVTTNVVLKGSGAEGDPVAATYRVEVPTGYTVTVDGEALTEADVVVAAKSVLPEDFLPSGVSAPTLTEYGFDSESEAPNIVVTTPAGQTAELQPDGENRWTCPVPENTEFREKYGQAVIKLGERIAKYTAKDLSRAAILTNVVSDSPAEKILKKFSNSWAPSHKSSSINNAVVSEFYVLSEDCFTCRVEFNFVLTSRRENDYVYPTAYTLCVVRRKGEGKLYNIVFN